LPPAFVPFLARSVEARLLARETLRLAKRASTPRGSHRRVQGAGDGHFCLPRFGFRSLARSRARRSAVRFLAAARGAFLARLFNRAAMRSKPSLQHAARPFFHLKVEPVHPSILTKRAPWTLNSERDRQACSTSPTFHAPYLLTQPLVRMRGLESLWRDFQEKVLAAPVVPYQACAASGRVGPTDAKRGWRGRDFWDGRAPRCPRAPN
jgi:hypothetical protein